MVDGELRLPEEEVPTVWQELRVGTPQGMVTVRREPDRVRLVTWGNADAAMLQAWNALAWAFYLLAQHPDVTAKVLEELDRELKGEPPMSSADLERLIYLEQVAKEVLRLYPPAPFMLRQTEEGFQLGDITFNFNITTS